MTDTITFYGLSHLVGDTVSVFVGGLDCGDTTVAADGSVTINFGSDPDGDLTPAYLQSLDGADWGEQAAAVALNYEDGAVTVTVPVVIGLPYTSRGQQLRPATEADIKSPNGPALGKMRRGHAMAILLVDSGPFNYGTNLADLKPAKLVLGDRFTAAPVKDPFTGVFQETLPDGYGFDTMLMWEVTRPVPYIVTSVTTFLHGSEK